MKTFITGLIFGILLAPVLLYLYFLSGRAPVTAPDQPLPLEAFFAGTALHARMNREMPKTVPLAASDATLLAGAQVYKRYCGGCHGMLGRPESPVARGMSPHPPQLLEPNSMVTDDPPGESYWKVRNGIRLSGMPGFQAALSEEQMWQVSLLLANADKVSGAVKQELTFTPPPPPPPLAPAAPAKK